MNKCKECFYHSEEASTCEFYHYLVDENSNACLHFEFKEKDDCTESDR